MGFLQVNGLSDNNSDTTIATSLTGVATGSLIVVAVSFGSPNDDATVADTLSNTYTEIGTALWDSTDNQGLTVFYAKNATAGSPTITATFTTNTHPFRRIIAAEYSGIDTAAPLDQHAGQQVPAASSSTATDGITSGSVTTGNNGETIIGAVMDTSGTPGISAGTGFTQRGEYGGLQLEDKVQASAGSVAATWTFSAAHAYAAKVATFIAGGGGGTNASVTAAVAAATAASVAPPKPRPANPFSEINVRL